ncbi:MAG: NAD(P)/FAD-dependent oxidoreductase [Bacillota bacterium]
MRHYDVIVVGGGAGGVAAAKKASEDGLSVALFERDAFLGGVLNQCIHHGFGVSYFKEELTGPEYAERVTSDLETSDVTLYLNTTVTEINKNDAFNVTYQNEEEGEVTVTSTALVLTTGSYERTAGAINLPGDRPPGVMNAGTAQRYVNIEGYMVGRKVFILGSGDIGLIMARRMTLEGAEVKGVAEIMPHPGGLTRNVVQCLHDYDIPLYLSHTVSSVEGADELERITIKELDENMQPKDGTEKHFDVDTLLLSVGLIPDVAAFKSLTFDMDQRTNGAIVDQFLETSIDGLFISGNSLHIHDLVDNVTIESEKAGENARDYVKGRRDRTKREHIAIEAGEGIGYTLPQKYDLSDDNKFFTLSFRTRAEHEKAKVVLKQGDTVLLNKKKRFLNPGEMETLKVPVMEPLDKHTPLELSLEVE